MLIDLRYASMYNYLCNQNIFAKKDVAIMYKCLLTDRQKNMLRALPPGFRDGSINATWTIIHDRGEIASIGGFRNPEIRATWGDVRDSDFIAFVNCGFFRGHPSGFQYKLLINENLILEAIERDFADDEPRAGTQINISGDFRGSNINVASTLNNVQQSISSAPQLSDDVKGQLTQLIDELKEALAAANLSGNDADEAEILAHHTQVAVDQLNAPKPNKKLISISVDGLEQAAKNIERVAVPVAAIAVKIALLLRPLTM